jgi:hypothetical protein
MNIDIAEKLSVKIKCGVKNSSGTIYVNGNTGYIFTAKHSICPKTIDKCQINKRECNTCTLVNTYKAKVTTISVEQVGLGNLTINPEKVVEHKNKDLAILVFKDKDLPSITNLPNIKISQVDDINPEDKFVTCGYPDVAGNYECQPVHYSDVSIFKSEIYLKIDVNTVTNIEPAKDNMSANSGAGIIKKDGKKNLLVGIYTKTGDLDAAYGEYIDHTVNELLLSSKLPAIVFDNNTQQISTLIKDEFLDCFTQISHDLDLGKQRKLNLFTIKLDGKNIAYDILRERLSECIRLFSLPRKLIKQYEKENKGKKAVKEGDKIFLALQNENKVAELILQGFLEAHLKAPKLYSFLNSHDQHLQSAHVKLVDSNSCELVYSAARMGSSLQNTLCCTLNDLLMAIPTLSGADSLLSNHLFESTFDTQDQSIIEKLLMPTENECTTGIGNSFALFIGFDFNCTNDIRYKNAPEFSQLFHEEIKANIQTVLINMKESLDKFDIVDSELNCYLVPFTDINEFCQSFVEDL